MVIIGVLLLVVGAVGLIDIGLSSTGSTSVELLGWHLGAMGPGRLLLIGTAIGVVLTLGLLSVLSGQRRSRRRRRDRDQSIAGSNAENKRLAAELAEQQARTAEAEATVRTVPSTVPTGLVSSEDVQGVPPYPAETRNTGAEYVLGGGRGQDED